MEKLSRICLLLIFLALLGVRGASASDLDDGISKATDDSIDHDDQLGQRDRNITFIKRKAMSDADVAAHQATQGIGSTTAAPAAQGQPGSGSMNSVVLGPGGSVRGDIIIIDQSRGDKTQVIGR